jgi:hypothetical protein
VVWAVAVRVWMSPRVARMSVAIICRIICPPLVTRILGGGRLGFKW